MTVAVATSLIGVPPVQSVQVVVTGIVAGDVVTVWREWDGHVELVRGGYSVTATSTAMILADIAAPFGVTVTHRVQVGADEATDAIVVPEVDQSADVFSDPLSGVYALVDLLTGPQERSQAFVGSLLRPAGRSRAVSVYDVRAADAGSWELHTDIGAPTDEFLALLASGGPLVHRPGSAGRLNFPGTEFVQLLDVSRSLIGDEQVWAVSYEVVDEPDPDVPVALSTLADLADAYDTLTLDDLATDFVAGTLLDVATTDWASL